GLAVRELGVGRSAIHRYEAEGSRSIVAVAPVPSTGWMIGVGALEADVLTDVYRLRNVAALVAVGFLILGVAAAIFLGRQIAKPLHQVQVVIESAAAGELIKGVGGRCGDEIGWVADAVNITGDSLRDALT